MMKFMKFIIFICLFGLLWNVVFKILWLNDTAISNFYEEPKNSIDITYVGSSNAYAYFNTVLAYHLHGFTTGLMSTDLQPFSVMPYLINDSEKYQNPKLYIIDVAMLLTPNTGMDEGHVRKSIDSMKFSRNRINAIDEVLSYINLEKNDPNSKSGNNKINYYFSYLMYHNHWKYIKDSNFTFDERLHKGYLFSDLTVKIQRQNTPSWVNEEAPIESDKKKELLTLLSYLEKKKLNVLFVFPKRVDEKEQMMKANTIFSIIRSHGFKIINFNQEEDFEVDFSHDLYNSHHLNVYGATKYTLYFSKYLKEHYKLKDHRKDKKYQSWDEEYQRFKNDFKELTKRNFDEILEKYKKSYS